MHNMRKVFTVLCFVCLGLSMSSLMQGQMPPMGMMESKPYKLDPSVKSTFVPLAMGVPGVLYEPVQSGEKSHIAFFVMHAGSAIWQFSEL
jgi:hypothetical protein